MEIKMITIKRDDLCIIDTASPDLSFIAWALSKCFNAIYIEKNHQLIGYIDLSKRIKIFPKQFNHLTTQIQSIDYNQYLTTSDKSSFFENCNYTFLPILKDNQIEGELIKVTTPPSFAKTYWELLNDNLYLTLFNHIGHRILFSCLDERMYTLYNKLQQLNIFQLDIYTTPSPTCSVQSYDVVIFHSPNHELKSYKQQNILYASIDYIYLQLLSIYVLDFYKKNNIHFYYIQLPSLAQLPKALTKDLYPYGLSTFAQDTTALDKYYGDNHNRKFFENGDYKKVSVIDAGLKHCLKDCTSETNNVIDGKRLTTNSPTTYINSVHCFGPCIVRGGYVCDDSTIPSYLQKNINNSQTNWLRVLNYGVEGGINSIYDFHNMLSTTYRKNDIVILFSSGPHNYLLGDAFNINIIDPLPVYTKQNLPKPCIINSIMHVTHLINKSLADYIFNLLKLPSPLQNTITEEVKMNLNHITALSPELLSFKDTLLKYRLSDYSRKKIGAIVMNCNPFTLGHLYLVEESLKFVDYLYVFILEEDKSFFSFTERYQLAKACCTHLKNVTILPSGKFIISTLTFPEYFFKDQLQHVTINPTKDIQLFAQEIAPILNITYRFVGEEPLDQITAQYNSFLKETLKWYNIHLIELPRKSIDNKVISASLVRNLIKQGNIEATKDLLPLATYNFINNKFS